MGKGSGRRPRLVSREEYDLRCDYMNGKLGITEDEMKKRIGEIREKHASIKK